MESEPMSSETNLPTDSDAMPEESAMTEAVDQTQEFVLDPEIEPFDLSPEDPAVAENLSEYVVSESTSELEATIAELSQTIESLKAQLEDRSGQYMRLAADFENYRKRTQKEKEEQEQQVKCTTVKELLPVVDNFERARAQLKPQTDSEMTIHKSYQGVYKQLVDGLKKLGVSPMRAEGQEFDPNLHEAVMREATEDFPEGAVMEELMRGYVIGDRVLRHAMVKVAAAPESLNNSENEATL
ncbi:MAG: nucleotide exchange factor GrpE [Leptolyngbyaceae cyanobacterium CRU_2_3]|nr:nucleotide exchange factor GrpE [Leptolyngbyaceae cyanobacterium CRU_2_3]